MVKNHKRYCVQKLALKNTKPFAEGVNRLCFIHPENNARCIKVVKEGSIAFLRSKRSFIKNLRSNSYFDDNLNEYNAYQQSAITKGGNRIYDHIPRCYGWQETDIGKGLVLDYYSQDNDKPCMTLEAYLKTNGLTPDIEEKLNELADYLRETRLMTKNIISHNVVIGPDGKLKIIDGIGASSAFSIANFNNAAKKNYITRRVERMFLRVKWEVGDRKKSWKETEKSGQL